jgi:hypothetical protein
MVRFWPPVYSSGAAANSLISMKTSGYWMNDGKTEVKAEAVC